MVLSTKWAALALFGLTWLHAGDNSGGPAWPCWRGPDGSGSASSGVKLLEDISQAKLVWKSEWIPGVYGAIIQSGNSGVIVADGKVFLIYQVPNDDVYDQEYVKKMLEAKAWAARGGYNADPAYVKAVADPSLREAYAKKKFAISADDVIHCFDAGSGKTLWKAVFEKKGFNPTKQGRGAFICAKCAPHSTPCFYQGKVYAIGSTARVYCVDAKDGKPVWESDLGAAHKALEDKKAKAREGKTLPEYGRMDNATGPVAAGGVIVAYDEGAALIGFDPATGNKLWTTPGAFGKYVSSPVRWAWQGKEYVVASGSKGTCLDPKTGKVCWAVDMPPVKEPGTASVYKDYALFGSTCFRITPEKATKLWGPVHQAMAFRTAVFLDDWAFFCDGPFGMVELATGKQAASFEYKTYITCGSSMIGGDGRVFKEIGRDEGSAILMAISDPAKFAKFTQLKVPNYGMSTTPVYLDGRLYFRMQDGVVCYDLRAK
jgi:outer membrane protein assembly factor BamB